MARFGTRDNARVRFALYYARKRRLAKISVSVPTVPQTEITINSFSADKVLFDSGFAFSRNVAGVPISGTATPGETIQARAVSVDDGGATTTAWSNIATADVSGDWSGEINVPRSSSWFVPSARIASEVSTFADGANRFGVGHVIAIWGQSEPDRILNTFTDAVSAPIISDDDAVQVIYGAASTPTRHHVTNAAPLTSALAAFTHTLQSTRSGDKFAVIFQTVPGTDPRELVNDGNPGRSWSSDKALHDFATADGQNVGIAAMSWFASPGSLGSNYGQAMFPLFSGMTTAGVPVSFPATITYGSGLTYHADHWFGELYDYANTAWVPYGPHRFDIDADLQDATHYVGGAIQSNLTSKQAARQSWRSMLLLPDATMFLPLTVEPLTYVNGVDDGAGGWTDFAHPAGNTIDGCQAFARLTAAAILQSAGFTNWSPPQFDNCFWEPTGSYVEVWSSEGDIITTRLARDGEEALPATYPHWTEVTGFQINGQPAQNASIVAGKVRLTKNGGGNFTYTDVLTFGEGGATGNLKFPEDYTNNLWKNLPIVNVGVAGLNGIPVSAMPSSIILANDLPSSIPSFTTIVSPSTYFVSPSGQTLNNSQFTLLIDATSITTPATSANLLLPSGGRIALSIIAPSRAIRLTLKDSANTSLLTNVSYAAIPTGAVKIVLSVNLVARTAKIWVNGTLWANETLAANTGLIDTSNRALGLLASNAGAGPTAGTWNRIAVWTKETTDGSDPSTGLIHNITGPAAVANADAWKVGANTT